MSIKYRYALDEGQRVIDIEDLMEADRKDYECVACSQVLRPVMGQKRRKHFRHKVDLGCSEETYLHRLGKFLFRQVYLQCLDSGIPFEVELLRPKMCRCCETWGPCRVSFEPMRYDLTKGFPNISLETPDDGFIPDLLLSGKGGEKLYVEIAVTHPSTETKRDSDHRIIELSVEEEKDLEIIKTCLLPETKERIDLIGFNVEPEEGDYSDQCNQWVSVFYLWHSGKTVIQEQTLADLRRNCHDRNKRFYFSFVSYAGKYPYVEALERAYLRNLKVENCYLCRYHGEPNVHQNMETRNPVFCKYLKETYPSNHAADCEYYLPDETTFGTHMNGKIGDLPHRTTPFFSSLGMKKVLGALQEQT